MSHYQVEERESLPQDMEAHMKKMVRILGKEGVILMKGEEGKNDGQTLGNFQPIPYLCLSFSDFVPKDI